VNARCDREPRAGRPMQQVLRWGGTIRCASPWQQQLHRIGPRDDPGLFVILALSLSLSLSPAHSYHGNYLLCVKYTIYAVEFRISDLLETMLR